MPAGATGTVQEIGRLFVVVVFADGHQRHYARQQLLPVPLPEEGADGCGHAAAPSFGIAGVQPPRGGHCCLLSSGQNSMMRAAASFAAAGLRDGETVVCAVPGGWRAALLSALGLMGIHAAGETDRGQLILTTPSRLYLPRSQFSAEGQLEKTMGALSGAARANPKGARAFAFAGTRPALPGWWEYEQKITPLLAESGVTALCVYQSTRCGTAPWRRAVELHPYVVRDGRVTQGGVATA